MAYIDLIVSIRSLLLSETEISNTVNGKVHASHLPQTLSPPAIVLWTVSEDANDVLDGPLGFDSALVQVDCYGKTAIDANQLWQMVRKKLAGFIGTVDGIHIKGVTQTTGHRDVTDRAEAGSGEYRYISSQDFSFYYCSMTEI